MGQDDRPIEKSANDEPSEAGGSAFWKIAAAGASFQAGSSAVDSATIVANLVYQLTGNVFLVGVASAVLRLGWLVPQIVVGFLAGRARRRMPYYAVGAFGRAFCLACIVLLFWSASDLSPMAVAAGFLVLWTLYAFISGIVGVPYNDIVGRVIPSNARSRMLAWRFFGGGVLALGAAGLAHHLLETAEFHLAHALIFALAAALMLLSSLIFVSVREPRVAPSDPVAVPQTFGRFLRAGREVLETDTRFRLFLYSQWLGGATLMALPFYVVAARQEGLSLSDAAILLGAQTAGALASNIAWGRIGDQFGKLRLLEFVGTIRLLPPLGALFLLYSGAVPADAALAAFMLVFFILGALINGTTIGNLGFLMEISPDDRRPAYSAYFNVLAAPAALLPILGAVLVDVLSLEVLFIAALAAAGGQLILFRRLRTEGAR